MLRSYRTEIRCDYVRKYQNTCWIYYKNNPIVHSCKRVFCFQLNTSEDLQNDMTIAVSIVIFCSKKVQVGKDQEKAQSEKDSHSKTVIKS